MYINYSRRIETDGGIGDPRKILDTYIDWSTFENEDEKADRLSRLTKESLEDYIKGHELDQWNNLLQKLNENQTIQNNFNE